MKNAILIFGIFLCIGCKTSKPLTNQQKTKLRTTDSIKRSQINSRILDLQEEMHEQLDDRSIRDY